MREYGATHNLVAVSANSMETAIHTAQTLDTCMLVPMSAVPNPLPRTKTNADEAIGQEEPDYIYRLGQTVEMPFPFEIAQAQHLAFVMAYALGDSTPAAAGSGYEHTSVPITGRLDSRRDIPSFTLGFRAANQIMKERWDSMFMDSFDAEFPADDWLKIRGRAIGTGLVTRNLVEETVNAFDDATSLTLAANDVEGADAATRLNNVHQIRIEHNSGQWTEVEYSAVSDATPAVITITDPGGGHALKDYKILYIAGESGWMSFPSQVEETGLHIAELTFTYGGAWNGSAFVGGRTIDAEISNVRWSFSNNGRVVFVPGAGGDYAGRYVRGGRRQILSLDREFRDYIVRNYMDQAESFGVYILGEGDVYDSPHKYQTEIIFPEVQVVRSQISTRDRVLAEKGDMQVLEGSTYDSVITNTKNLQTGYAQ